MTYTEDSLVKQPAIQLFAELGWMTLVASDEVLGAEGTLGRETNLRWYWRRVYIRFWRS